MKITAEFNVPKKMNTKKIIAREGLILPVTLIIGSSFCLIGSYVLSSGR